MKTLLIGALIFTIASISFGGVVHAQMMYDNGYNSGVMHTYVRERVASTTATTTDSGDAVGAALWQKLSAGQVTCSSLSQSDFAALGDYYMSTMMGAYHDQADAYMTQRLGAQGDEAVHVIMGERLSGCDPAAAYPSGVSGFYPVMGEWGMMNGWGGPGYTHGPFTWAVQVVLWILALVGVAAIIRWLMRGHRD